MLGFTVTKQASTVSARKLGVVVQCSRPCIVTTRGSLISRLGVSKRVLVRFKGKPVTISGTKAKKIPLRFKAPVMAKIRAALAAGRTVTVRVTIVATAKSPPKARVMRIARVTLTP